jgi:hypothetical protein
MAKKKTVLSVRLMLLVIAPMEINVLLFMVIYALPVENIPCIPSRQMRERSI